MSTKAKLPPQNLEAEASILGALMLDPESWDYISDIIQPEDFYRGRHQKIYAAICTLQQKNEPVDIITVSNTLKEIGEIDNVGGSQYLAELIDQTLSSANITTYAKIVREASVLRKLINTSSQVIEKAYDQDFENFEGFLGDVEGQIYNISQNEATSGLVGSAEIVKNSMQKLDELFHKGEDVTGVPCGFIELDNMTAGFHPGEMTIIAARPSMGKTAFSLNIAQHMAINEKKTVAYFSVEMVKEQLMTRLLASQAKVSMSKLRVGKFSNDREWPAIIDAAAKLSQSNLYIDDTSGISPFEIRAKCRRLKSQKGLDVIMVDYLQIMDLKKKVDSRERAVAEISKSLKEIAKELSVPVLALAQLNRGVEGRGSDRRPMLSDLRESGSIEQDADLIMMLFREEYYDRDNPDIKGQAEVIVGKHRNGPTGTVKLRWRADIGQFENPDAHYVPGHVDDPGPQEAPPGPGAPPPGPPKNYAPT